LVLVRASSRRGLIQALGSLTEQAVQAQGGAPPVWTAGGGSLERLAVVAPRTELAARLKAVQARIVGDLPGRLSVPALGMHYGRGDLAGRMAFLFPGQGSQYPGMLRNWTGDLPTVRHWFDCLDAVHRRGGYPAPSELIYGLGANQPAQKQALMDIARGAQLGTVASLALWEVLWKLGLCPSLVLGHSNGEHAAVMGSYLGFRKREAICEWLYRTSRTGLALGEPPAPEGLAVVGALRREALNGLMAPFADRVFLAMDNCPNQLVVGGTRASLAELADCIQNAGGVNTTLPLQRAYHTPLFREWAEVLRKAYDMLPLSDPEVPVVSCRTGEVFCAEPASTRELMASQWTHTVHFRSTVLKLYSQGVNTFVEVGPNNRLSAFIEDTLRGHSHLAVSMAPEQLDVAGALCRLFAMLHAFGVPVDGRRLTGLIGNGAGHDAPASVPAYIAPQIELIDAGRASLQRAEALFQSSCAGPVAKGYTGALLGEMRTAGPRLAVQKHLSLESHVLVRDHCFGRWPGALAVLPFTLTWEVAAEAARCLGAPASIVLREARAGRWLALDGACLDLCISAVRGSGQVAVAIGDGTESSGPAFQVTASLAPASFVKPFSPPAAPIHEPSRWTVDRFYRDYAFHGPAYRALRRITAIGPGWIAADAVGCVSGPEARGGAWVLDPALLDCAGQLVAFWMLEYLGNAPDFGVFPYSVSEVRSFGPPAKRDDGVRIEAVMEQTGSHLTRADFLFRTATGRLLASLRGFSQRRIEMAPALADWVLRGNAVPFSTASGGGSKTIRRRLRISDWTGLLDNGGIWQRAVASLALNREEHNTWRSLSGRPLQQLEKLLSYLLVKEAVREATQRAGNRAPAYSEIALPDNASVAFDPDQDTLSVTLRPLPNEALVLSSAVCG
jgi:malonyl CoA-acyl carrier protein transacylase